MTEFLPEGIATDDSASPGQSEAPSFAAVKVHQSWTVKYGRAVVAYLPNEQAAIGAAIEFLCCLSEWISDPVGGSKLPKARAADPLL